MKKCSKCLRNLDESNFNWKIKNVRLQYHCKKCSREYVRNHYQNNVNYYILKARKRNTAIKNEIIEFLGNYFATHPCVDCGEKDVLVLEFDHRDRLEKFDEVSKLISNRGKLEKVEKEVEKCDVRCANCHRRKTSIESKSWRLKYANSRP